MRQPTVWSMMDRIRKAMTGKQADLLSGIVEMDETYIGGNPRGRGTKKECVVGMIERNGKVKTIIQKRLRFEDLKNIVSNNINVFKSILITDDFKVYKPCKRFMSHYSVNHSKGEYSRNGINTNSIESFWTIVKRGMMGQFHWVSKKYLSKYKDEFTFRFNNRNNENTFELLLKNSVNYA